MHTWPAALCLRHQNRLYGSYRFPLEWKGAHRQDKNGPGLNLPLRKWYCNYLDIPRDTREDWEAEGEGIGSCGGLCSWGGREDEKERKLQRTKGLGGNKRLC